MPRIKTNEEYFRDWEISAFGYGYGTGEPHIIPALKKLLEATPESGCYDFLKLEEAVGASTAWLLINILCRVDIFEYGTSPRFGWLTNTGNRLQSFVKSHSADELIEMATSHNEGDDFCYPTACNCGEHGYEEGVNCPNPFWTEHLSKDELKRG